MAQLIGEEVEMIPSLRQHDRRPSPFQCVQDVIHDDPVARFVGGEAAVDILDLGALLVPIQLPSGFSNEEAVVEATPRGSAPWAD